MNATNELGTFDTQVGSVVLSLCWGGRNARTTSVSGESNVKVHFMLYTVAVVLLILWLHALVGRRPL